MACSLATIVVFLGLFGPLAHASDDAEALLQQSLLTHRADMVSGMVEKLIKDRNMTVDHVLSMAQEETRVMRQPRVMATFQQISEEMRSSLNKKDMFAKGWEEFVHRAKASVDPRPQVLLNHAKAALMQTGAMEEMRKMAVKAKATTQGAVPLDSMAVGFSTSLAPWNNVLQEFSLPLIKADFGLFANFFGPEGNAARLCIHANMKLDSTYGVHSRSEFGGIGVFAGPMKWDNVPGWRFGASGGMDNMQIFDVADFGWDFTLSSEPETVGFHWDIDVIDSEGLHASTLQTKAEVESEIEEQSESIPNHGSTYIGHVWCSPDWTNTPLVIEDLSQNAKKKPADVPVSRALPDVSAKAEEEIDPDDDAV